MTSIFGFDGGVSGGGYGSYTGFSSAGEVAPLDEVGGMADVGDAGGFGDLGGVESDLRMAQDRVDFGAEGQTSALSLEANGPEFAPAPWEDGEDPLAGLFPDDPDPSSSSVSPFPDATGPAAGRAREAAAAEGPVDITDAGRALADRFGPDRAWEMAKALRDRPNGRPEELRQFQEVLGRNLTAEQLRDVEHYLYAAADVGANDGMASRTVAAAKMATLTTGYSVLKAVAQHTGNSELEKNAAQYWSRVADDVPTDGSAWNAAKYVGAKVMQSVVSPIDIRNALGMGSNVRSSRATWSEFWSGMTGTFDGLTRDRR